MLNSVYRAPLLGLLILVMMLSEKMLAHTYTVLNIYVLPEPWKWWVPGVIGLLGLLLVIKGMGRDEVKGSLMGYLGAVLIWMSWFESFMPVLGRFNRLEPVLPKDGNMMAGLMGEHQLLEASGVFCVMTLFFIMLNKDVRCRMLLWIRRRIGLGAEVVGTPTSGYRPNVARVAAFEYFFVTWFMYVLMLVIVDPRLNGLHHPVTYAASLAVGAWGIYLVWKLTQQREVGLAIRYGIGAVGVLWYIPEALALYEWLYEFYLYANKHPIAVTAILVAFIAIIVALWRTPINPATQRSV